MCCCTVGVSQAQQALMLVDWPAEVLQPPQQPQSSTPRPYRPSAGGGTPGEGTSTSSSRPGYKAALTKSVSMPLGDLDCQPGQAPDGDAVGNTSGPVSPSGECCTRTHITTRQHAMLQTIAPTRRRRLSCCTCTCARAQTTQPRPLMRPRSFAVLPTWMLLAGRLHRHQPTFSSGGCECAWELQQASWTVRCGAGCLHACKVAACAAVAVACFVQAATWGQPGEACSSVTVATVACECPHALPHPVRQRDVTPACLHACLRAAAADEAQQPVGGGKDDWRRRQRGPGGS